MKNIYRSLLLIIIGAFGSFMSVDEPPNIWSLFVVLGVLLILINKFKDKLRKRKK